MEKMTINQLPSRTWNRLGVNEASIDWDESATVVLTYYQLNFLSL